MFYAGGKRHIGGQMHAWAVPQCYPPGFPAVTQGSTRGLIVE